MSRWSRTASIVSVIRCLMALALVAGWLVPRRFRGFRYPKANARSLRRRHFCAAHSRLVAVFVTLIIYTAFVLVLPETVHAAVFNCSSSSLPSPVACLISAINTANGNGVADTINLDGSTFTLPAVDNNTNGPNGLPSITTEIAIEGNGSIIERDASDTDKFRIFHVSLAGNLTLNNVTVRNGLLPNGLLSDSWGGGIFNLGTLHITNGTVSDNKAGDDGSDVGFGGFGGGIFNAGTANLTNSTISDNRAGNSSG